MSTVDPVHPEATHKTLLDALGATRPSWAVVASPTETHFEAVRTLVNHGVPTLVEKPVSYSLDQAEELVDLSERSGVFVAAGHVERFNPAIGLVHERLTSGQLGRPISLSSRRVGLPPKSSGEHGVVHDLGVHDIDIFSYLIGEPRLVAATGWPRNSTPQSAFLLLSCKDVDMSIEVNWKTPVRLRYLAMTTTTCTVGLDYTSQRVEVTSSGDQDNPSDFADFQAKYSSANTQVLRADQREPLKEQVLAFLEAKDTGYHPVLASLRDGVRAVGLACKAVEAIRA